MTTNRCIRFGVVGLHGFSRSHINSLQCLAQAGAGVKLAAVVARRQNEDYADSLKAAGVKLVSDLDALLALKNEIDVVTVPVGIALHVPMAEQALKAGYAVYLEKPVTGAIQDFDRLSDAERRTPGPLFIGFQDIFQPSLWELKRRLLAGGMGPLRRAVIMAAWPRAGSYYERNTWAGRLSLNGTWVLDSPLNNACAHYINLVLFLAGASLPDASRPLEVTAELYRAYPIESADTTAVRVRTAEGVEIVFLASHACEQSRGPVFRLECEAGKVTGDRGDTPDKDWHLCHRSGQADRITVMPDWVDPFYHVVRVLQGEKEAPVCTLAMSRSHTLVVNGAFLSSPIHEVPAAFCGEVTQTDRDQTQTCKIVKGLNDCLNVCFEKGCLPSESGAAGWARPGKSVDVSNLRCFAPPG